MPPPAIAGVLLSAILSDTLVFASPTCVDKDRDMAGRLEFDLAGHRVGIGQIEATDTRSILARRPELIEELRRVGVAKGLELVLLLVTDIAAQGSHLWVVGDQAGIVEQAFGGRLVDGGMYLDGCMSRKKQVVPPLERAYSRLASPPVGSDASSTPRV